MRYYVGKEFYSMGLFIDLEGLDGCGKTTQTELLCKRFEKENIKYKKSSCQIMKATQVFWSVNT